MMAEEPQDSLRYAAPCTDRRCRERGASSISWGSFYIYTVTLVKISAIDSFGTTVKFVRTLVSSGTPFGLQPSNGLTAGDVEASVIPCWQIPCARITVVAKQSARMIALHSGTYLADHVARTLYIGAWCQDSVAHP